MSSTAIREEKYLDLINQFAIGLLNQSTIKETLWSVIDNVIAKLDFQDCSIYLLEDKENQLHQVASLSNQSERQIKSKLSIIPLGTGIVGKVALEKKAIITNDTTLSEDYRTDDLLRYSEITVPIIHENRLIGVIDSEHSDKDFFQPIHLNILTTIASMVAIKIVQARQYENLLERDQRFDLIYSSTNDLIFLMTVEPNGVYRCASVNRAFLDLTKKSKNEVIGKTIFEIWDEARARSIIAHYEEAIASRQPVTYEIMFGTGQEEVIVETKVTPIYDKTGQCTNLSGISRDITTAKKVRHQLKSEREKYQMLFSKANDAIFILKDDIIVECNDRTLELFGRSRGELIGLRPMHLSPELQPDGMSSDRVIEEDNFHWVHTKKDGTPFTVEVALSRYYFDDQEYTQAIVRDVSERIRAEKKLKESKERFESLFESSPNAIFIHDFDKITHVNQAFLTQFGYKTKEEVIGKPALETTVYEEDIPIAIEARKKEDHTEFGYIPNIRLIRSDGTLFDSETYLSSVIIDEIRHLQVITHDITERNRTEEVLRTSEERYRSLFENSLDGIYKSTPEGKFVEVSPALVTMLGYDSTEDLLSIDIKTDLYFATEDRYKHPDQYRLKKKDGHEIWVEDHGYYQYDEEGHVIFHHGILRDVTLKNQKQEEMHDLLNMTSDQNKRLQNFAHIVSHNIRSHSANLTSLVSFLEVTEDQEEREKMFQMLKSSTIQLEETITNLNEIITVNQNLNKPAELRNFLEEVEKTLQILSIEIQESKTEIKLKIPSDLQLSVIPAYLDSILLNLISNAIKYRRPEVTPKVTIQAKVTKKGVVRISIADNGLGINLEANHDKVFGMYNTFHDNEDARGFGLYITKNQIEAMKGTIDVKSQVGEGTTFTIQFYENN